MVGSFGEVYLLDWGIALPMSDAGGAQALAGTPAYMAPEMVDAAVAPLAAYTDVYLLGATLYEVLTGKPRHEGTVLDAVLQLARISAPPRFPVGVPMELAALCTRSTARDPALRPQSALRFRQAIDDYLQHRGAEALSALADERLAELSRLLSQPGGDRAEILRAGIECRFAYEQALRVWPESPTAQSGRQACLKRLCQEAIAGRQAVEAAALLREIRPVDEELGQKLRRLAHEANTKIGSRARVLMGVGVLSLGLTVSWFSQGLRLPTHREMVWLMSVVLALSVAIVALLRRRLLRNQHSRRMVGMVLTLTGSLLANRLVGAAQGTAVTDVLLGDLLLSTALPTMAIILGHRRLLAGALISLVGMVAALLWQRQIALIYPLAIVGAQLSYLVTEANQTDAG